MFSQYMSTALAIAQLYVTVLLATGLSIKELSAQIFFIPPLRMTKGECQGEEQNLMVWILERHFPI